MTKIEPSPAPRNIRILLTILLLAGASVLLFARLGRYALWDDEAYTALSAEAVWQTGDTSAIIGHNLFAFRQGALLKDLRDTYQPPLQAFVAAPFVGWMGNTSLAARLPFAICGLISVALIARWLWKLDASTTTWVVTCIAVLFNVSLFLYLRQRRYYALTMLLTIALAYIYVFWNGKRAPLVAFAILSLFLMASNLMVFAAFNACLLIDYLVFTRDSRPLSRADIATIVLPQLILGGLLLWIWNPFGLDPPKYRAEHPLLERAILLFWNWRDLNRCEFGVGFLLLLAPLLYFRRRDKLVLRALAAMVIFIVVVTIVSPQPVGATVTADVRYICAIIPLCIGIGVWSVVTLTRAKPALAIVLALAAFGTNLLQTAGGAIDGLRTTPILFAQELIHPPTDPYTAASKWVASNVEPNASIWVMPGHMTYPLMYHEPHAIYAWQLSDPPAPQFANLPDIHFLGRVSPDYVITFGPIGPAGQSQTRIRGASYSRVQVLDVFGVDLYRPEIISRTFTPIEHFDREKEGISIYKLNAASADVRVGDDR